MADSVVGQGHHNNDCGFFAAHAASVYDNKQVSLRMDAESVAAARDRWKQTTKMTWLELEPMVQYLADLGLTGYRAERISRMQGNEPYVIENAWEAMARGPVLVAVWLSTTRHWVTALHRRSRRDAVKIYQNRAAYGHVVEVYDPRGDGAILTSSMELLMNLADGVVTRARNPVTARPAPEERPKARGHR